MTATVKMILLSCAILSVIYALTASSDGAKESGLFSWNAFTAATRRTNNICWKNKHWYLHEKLATWKLAPEQMLYRHFPIDAVTSNYVREVKGSIFSVVYPTPLARGTRIAAVSARALERILDMDTSMSQTRDFLGFASGNKVLPESTPLSHRYGGHQFGYWADQLGDGRAVLLGEYINSHGERWELQLKGSGLTPYSRRADGRAVIRSSIREFLCSEAMHALGLPTSRAASLVISSEPVIRDQFYNGNFKTERAAVVLRLAPSWFRIGSLEILAIKNEISNLKNLTDFIIANHFPFINMSDTDRVLSFFHEVVKETAYMIAQWQGVGFTHGVCNTDNFSILSITIDYGPFGFMEKYDSKYVPNTSDDEGRYSYENQPDVGYFNLNKLRIALLPLLNKKQRDSASDILKGYNGIYKSKFMKIFLKKLGFLPHSSHKMADLEQFLAVLLKVMEDTHADFTMTFRELSEISLQELIESITNNNFSHQYWTLPVLSNHDWFSKWVSLYNQYIQESGISDIDRQEQMLRTNPRYVLRNWIAQTAIEKAEQNDFSEVNKVLEILTSPYDINKDAESAGFASPPPKWSTRLRVSCSS